MARRNAIGKSLKCIRLAQSFTQEDFVEVSGRTYISQIERGIKTPTIDKIDDLANSLGIHPLTLLTLAYLPHQRLAKLDALQQQIAHELETLLGA
jgi:transcriptional regulator with XRE-family HTH domain